MELTPTAWKKDSEEDSHVRIKWVKVCLVEPWRVSVRRVCEWKYFGLQVTPHSVLNPSRVGRNGVHTSFWETQIEERCGHADTQTEFRWRADSASSYIKTCRRHIYSASCLFSFNPDWQMFVQTADVLSLYGFQVGDAGGCRAGRRREIYGRGTSESLFCLPLQPETAGPSWSWWDTCRAGSGGNTAIRWECCPITAHVFWIFITL